MKVKLNRGLTVADRAKFAELGILVDERGGDPKRSVLRDPRANRTGCLLILSRVDGRQVIRSDVAFLKGE